MTQGILHTEEAQGDSSPNQGSGSTPRHSVLLHVCGLVLLCGVLLLFRIGSLPLADPEESRCALVVQDMLQTGDWLVPHLEGQVYTGKPAAFFWLAALTQRLIGSPEAAGRLVAAVAGLVCVLVAYDLGRRMWGPAAGLLAGVILATTSEFQFLARWYRMDMPLVAAMWAALWCFWRAASPAPASAPSIRRWGWCGFYACCAVATLLKGPVGLGLPVLIVIGYLLLRRQPRRLLELLNPAGIGLFFLIAAPWYVAMSLREPQYLYEFLVHENLDRYATEQLGHAWSVVFYVPILLAGLVPWTACLPGVFLRYLPGWRSSRSCRPEVLFLWLAAGVPFVFFTLAKTKMANYILPVLPPLAVLMGAFFAEWLSEPKPDRVARGTAFGMAGFLLVVPLIPFGVELWLQCLDLWIALAFLAAALAAAWMVWCLKRDRRRTFLGVAVGGAVFLELFAWSHTATAGYDRMSTRSLARAIGPQVPPGSEYCFWPYRRLSFVFYTQAYGLAMTESKPVDFFKRARENAPDHGMYCMVAGRKKLQMLLEGSPFPVYVLGRSGDCWLIGNQPPAGVVAVSPLGPASRPGRLLLESLGDSE